MQRSVGDASSLDKGDHLTAQPKPPWRRFARKPRVWYVDDLPENCETFKKRHAEHFDLTLFSTVQEVDDALRGVPRSKRPQALLCDIYFYDDLAEAREVERQVEEKRADFEASARKWNVFPHADGIRLIERVRNRYPRQFPVFAYTTKAPYLMMDDGYNRLAAAGAQFLFKSRLTVTNERTVVREAIERTYLRTRVVNHPMFWATLGAVVGGLIVALALHLTPLF